MKALSQRTVARSIGAPRTYISKIENLHCTPTLATLPRLAAALGVPLAYLADESIPPEQLASGTWACGDELMGAIIEALAQLDGRQRHTLSVAAEKLSRGEELTFVRWVKA